MWNRAVQLAGQEGSSPSVKPYSVKPPGADADAEETSERTRSAAVAGDFGSVVETRMLFMVMEMNIVVVVIAVFVVFEGIAQ